MDLNRSIAERLIRRRMKEAIGKDTISKDRVEKVLNHRLGSYETGVKVLDLSTISKTPDTITLKVEYEVSIQIPIVDPEDHSTYYETEVEYRVNTITFDLSDFE